MAQLARGIERDINWYELGDTLAPKGIEYLIGNPVEYLDVDNPTHLELYTDAINQGVGYGALISLGGRLYRVNKNAPSPQIDGVSVELGGVLAATGITTINFEDSVGLISVVGSTINLTHAVETNLLPPVLVTPIPDVTYPDSNYAVSLDIGPYFTDPDSSFFISEVGLPAGLTINPVGLITGFTNPGQVAGSPYTVTVTATDTVNLPDATDTFDINIVPGTMITAIGTYTFAGPTTHSFTSISTPNTGFVLNLIEYTLTISDPGYPNDGRVIVVSAPTHADPITVTSDTGGTPLTRLTTPQLTGIGSNWSFDSTPLNDIALSDTGTIQCDLYVTDTGGGTDTQLDI